MKRVLAVLAMVAASMSYPTATIADEYKTGLSDDYSKFSTYMSKDRKDECLVIAKNCIVGDESVSKRIERLEREIEKGAAVYTPEELKGLLDQLNWIRSESADFSGDRI